MFKGPPMSQNTVRTSEDLDTEFWAECRKRAAELNIPAWKLAEELYQHRNVDARTKSR